MLSHGNEWKERDGICPYPFNRNVKTKVASHKIAALLHRTAFFAVQNPVAKNSLIFYILHFKWALYWFLLLFEKSICRTAD